ncbi:hypothetical protein NCS52_00570600 [Fusarium sp. LHS14.1]|nr:hypothetical protein NCS52_00570600 [Fusarium sp. LHS14.1]
MGLEDLCPEILFQICELFCEHCQGEWYLTKQPPEWWGLVNPRSSLLALSLVCKSIGSVAQQVLHHHVGYVDKYNQSKAKFCRTISNNPELAKSLRWANLSLSRSDKVPEEVVQGWLQEAINKFSHHLLGGGKRIQYKQLLKAIILLQAPNLEQLDDDSDCYKGAFHFLDHDAVIRDRALPPNLKNLRLGPTTYNIHGMTMVDISWDGIGGFIDTLNKLESLDVCNPLGSRIDERLSFDSLRTFQLREFLMPRQDLERLLSCMPKLEEFDTTRLFDGDGDLPKPATGPEILEVLAGRNDTLRRLELDMSCTHDNVEQLQHLTNLEELKIILGKSAHAAYRQRQRIDEQFFIRTMPPSLRKLHINRFHGRTMFEEASEALMTYISSTYRDSPQDQRLRMVQVDMQGEPRDWAVCQRDTFQQGCQEWAKNGTLVFDIDVFDWHEYRNRARNWDEEDQTMRLRLAQQRGRDEM